MSYQFTISDIGLRLIKAYEGYRAEPRTLASGNRVIGFGHAVNSDDMSELSEEDAEAALKADLAPIEDLINTHVHASMTQSQFDALCSLAFSIGEEAFMSSNILHAMNRGQIIEAANGFDLWRKGNIDGQVYVVDALVRRRTAEKALFLRPTQRTARAPRYELTAIKDTDLSEAEGVVELAASAPEFQAATTLPDTSFQDTSFQDNSPFQDDVAVNDDLDMELVQDTTDFEDRFESTRRGLTAAPVAVIYSEEEDEIETIEPPVVNIANSDDIMDLDMVAAPPTGALADTFTGAVAPVAEHPVVSEDDIEPDSDELAPLGEEAEDVIEEVIAEEVKVEDDQVETEVHVPDVEAPSPIAAAAAEVSDRLDALIDEPADVETETSWPDSLITSSIQSEEGSESPSMTAEGHTADVIIDELQGDDAIREQEARDSQFNTQRYVEYTNGGDQKSNGGLWAFFTMMIVGLTLLLAGLGINLKGAMAILGENGPFMTIVAMAIGCLLLIGGGWYLIKALFFQD